MVVVAALLVILVMAATINVSMSTLTHGGIPAKNDRDSAMVFDNPDACEKKNNVLMLK